MEEITLPSLLEAGCHFGHKSERWHPKARDFIYTEKDGIHIIDLAKTKVGLEAAMTFVKELVAGGGDLLFVGTKRQAMGVVAEEASRVGAPYFVERWIGGFLTNWEEIKKNIDKINRLKEGKATGFWKKFPKHEQSKLSRYLDRLHVFYGGVLTIATPPQAIFVVDVRREYAAVREAARIGIPVVGVVDTNSDPSGIDYVVPANDDAVGSIKFIAHAVASAYKEGKDQYQKQHESKEATQKAVSSEEAVAVKQPVEEAPKKKPIPAKATGDQKATVGKRGRPRKTESEKSDKKTDPTN